MFFLHLKEGNDMVKNPAATDNEPTIAFYKIRNFLLQQPESVILYLLHFLLPVMTCFAIKFQCLDDL